MKAEAQGSILKPRRHWGFIQSWSTCLAYVKAKDPEAHIDELRLGLSWATRKVTSDSYKCPSGEGPREASQRLNVSISQEQYVLFFQSLIPQTHSKWFKTMCDSRPLSSN